MFARAVRQRATVGTEVPVLRLLAFVDGPFGAFQPLSATLLHPLVGFPSFFAALLMDVIGRVGYLPTGLPPGGDALVHGIGVIATAALG